MKIHVHQCTTSILATSYPSTALYHFTFKGLNHLLDESPVFSVLNETLILSFSDIGDKLIEVVGLENCLHMGQVRTGLRSSGKRLAQCSHVIVQVKKRFPMQVDGEPWEQPPGTVIIKK